MTETKGKFRVATFNAENLFMRYRFRSGQGVYADEAGFTINNLAFDIYDEADKRVTARAIKETNADVLCLQEVESLPCLETFNARYIPGMRYRHRMLVDSHDPRHIDVAVLSRYPIVRVRSHRDERAPGNNAYLFSRDCLEVDVEVPGGKVFTLYVNHFKSMVGGRDATRAKRERQAQRVADIVDARLRDRQDTGNFAVVGDLNDYVDAKTSLGPLLEHKALRNVVDRLPQPERWAHYYAGGNEYRQLDYVLLSERVDEAAKKPVPGIVRKGLPWRAERYAGERFEEVGEEEPKASDHCPLYVDIPFSALR